MTATENTKTNARTASKRKNVGPQRRKQDERFSLIDSRTFAKSKSKPHAWIAEQLFVRNQLGVIGGPQKCLKTSIVLDAAVSLGLGMPVLGKFNVPSSLRVAVFSGESGEATIRESAERMCRARGKRLADCDALWSFSLPKFGDEADIVYFSKVLSKESIEVVFIDPLYLCLTGGGKSISPTNLYDVGPAIKSMVDACLNVGATPVIVHHTTKTASKSSSRKKERPRLGLGDLAFSGVGEIARQWLILDRRSEFQPQNGWHSLALAAGGSAGHSGEWNLEIYEGALKEDFSGRHWSVRVDGRQTLGKPRSRPCEFDTTGGVARDEWHDDLGFEGFTN